MGVEHEIEVFDARKRVRHPSGRNGETNAPLYAAWTIEARDGGKTTLRLVHSGFSVGADWDELASHARGWKLMLQNLRHYRVRAPIDLERAPRQARRFGFAEGRRRAPPRDAER